MFVASTPANLSDTDGVILKHEFHEVLRNTGALFNHKKTWSMGTVFLSSAAWVCSIDRHSDRCGRRYCIDVQKKKKIQQDNDMLSFLHVQAHRLRTSEEGYRIESKMSQDSPVLLSFGLRDHETALCCARRFVVLYDSAQNQ